MQITMRYVIATSMTDLLGKASSESEEFTIGLWRLCISDSDIKTCFDLECSLTSEESSTCRKIIAARAFVTLACILSGISIICLIIYTMKRDSTFAMLLLVTKGLVVACLIMGIIGVAVGIDATVNIGGLIKLDLGAAAAIGIVAIILNFIGTIITLLIKP
ncbi:unnamed protein product [Rotaria sp. Silwood1]|nr:unnamed protein product [Rotaria sp. Silwood1]CAF3731354.1 unnamed protein product [Rotaria sp. Silwood1]CAF4815393.1 unnamed protein product [Rotaria sp. Silwood1]CAF4839801.1 unnamed protein product [Rotaria sp. Silwood1]